MGISGKTEAQKPLRRGRPAGRSKTVVSISLDTEVLAALKASGKGWQTRLNNLLKALVAFKA
ncbi:MAG TPA: hypothetical protein DCY07_02830 [Rhodospirillaceae bacterium]|nr:hypothetical protein [Rhodospirillaceae bacterium]